MDCVSIDARWDRKTRQFETAARVTARERDKWRRKKQRSRTTRFSVTRKPAHWLAATAVLIGCAFRDLIRRHASPRFSAIRETDTGGFSLGKRPCKRVAAIVVTRSFSKRKSKPRTAPSG